MTRDRLADMLWGLTGEEQARASLRQTLSTLRKALGADSDMLVPEGEMLSLDEARVDVDLARLEALVAAGDGVSLRAAAELARGGLLEDLDLREEGYEAWLEAERPRVRELVATAITRCVEHFREAGDRLSAIDLARRLLTLDPFDEPANRCLMELYGETGRRADALRHFEAFGHLLHRELGIAPAPETRQLAAKLRAEPEPNRDSGSAGPKSEAGGGPSEPLPLPDKPSIAVLPFANLGGDSEQEYFSDGIAEEIITGLSRYTSLFVIARNSSFVYRGQAVDIRKIGRELGVRFVLEGSVRRAGDRVRVASQLIDASSGNHLWAERYDAELGDVFDIQDEISRAIVSTLAGRIEDLSAGEARGKATDNLKAYDFVLRGQKFMQRYTREDYSRAREMFDQAIALDPHYARAFAWLAVTETYDWFWNMADGGLDRPLEIGWRAIELDPHESKSHLALGVTHLFRWEHEAARHHLERAAALNPNDDLVIVENGRLAMYLGRPDEGATRVREAMRRNPYHSNWYWNILGRCLHTAERYDEAITAFQRIDTPQFWVRAYLAGCYAALGRKAEAKGQVTALLEVKPDFTVSGFSSALPYEDPETLERFLDTLRDAGLPQ